MPLLSTVAGNGIGGYSGDGGIPTAASLYNPVGVAVDAQGNLYVADFYNSRIRKVTPGGLITTIAGNGTSDSTGDGGPATSASVRVDGVAVDASGNVYVASLWRIRKITSNGVINTIAGGSNSGFAGDGGPATSALLSGVHGLTVDAAGTLYFTDGNRIRRITTSGVISTVAGNGSYGYTGDGGAATAATLAGPSDVAVDLNGQLFVADSRYGAIRKITPAGIISTVAGGGPYRIDPVATSVEFGGPTGITVDAAGNLYIADRSHNLLRKVSKGGVHSIVVGQFNDTIFGNVGAPRGYGGDGGPAIDGMLNFPNDVAVDTGGNLYIADTENHRIRKVTPVPEGPWPSGIGAFQPYEAIPVGSWPDAVAVGDVTGDQRADVVLTTRANQIAPDPANDYSVFVFVQQADGRLAAPVKASYQAGNFSYGGLTLVDLNRDGIKDIVVGHSRGLTVYLGNPAATLQGTLIEGFSDVRAGNALVTLDVNLDGFVDIVSNNDESGAARFGLTTYLGDGKGGLRPAAFQAVLDGGTDIEAADMNGDGYTDVVALSAGIEVFLHDGRRGLMRGQVLQRPGKGISALALGDFDGDGRTDLVHGVPGNAPQAELSLFMQFGGQLSSPFTWRTYDIPEAAISGDMDGDKRADLLVVHAGWRAVGYYRQIDGGFDQEVKYFVPAATHYNPQGIALGDVNGDGCKDIVTANSNYGLVLLRGKNCMPYKAPPISDPQPALPLLTAGAIATPAVAVAVMLMDEEWNRRVRGGALFAIPLRSRQLFFH